MDPSLRDLIELAYGPDVDLHQDILKVDSSASAEEIQQAFVARRIELYESLQNASMLSNTERTFKDRNGGTVTMTERHYIEKKMDALIGTFRLLSDPSKNLTYMSESSRKKQNQSTPSTVATDDSPDMNEDLVNTPTEIKTNHPSGQQMKKQESTQQKSDEVKKPIRRKLFDQSFETFDSQFFDNEGSHHSNPPADTNATSPDATPIQDEEKPKKQKQMPQSILRKSKTDRNTKSSNPTSNYDNIDAKATNKRTNESLRSIDDGEQEDGKSVGTKSTNKPVSIKKKKKTKKVFIPLAKPSSSSGAGGNDSFDNTSRRLDRYYVPDDDETTVNDDREEYGALRTREEGLFGTVVGEIKGIMHDTMTSVEQVMNAFKIEDNDIDNFLIVLDEDRG